MSPHRTRSLRSLWLLALLVAASLLSGCRWLPRWGREECDSECACAVTVAPPPRRIYIITPGLPPPGAQPGLVPELIAALNAQPQCQAVPIPVELLPPPLPDGEIDFAAACRNHPEGMSLTAELDEVLIIHVLEVQPFRPMRVTARIERRMAFDGSLISQAHRTWVAPPDLEPLAPNPVNRHILRHPPPLGAVAQHELSRLSPRTFYGNIAAELALEIARPPF